MKNENDAAEVTRAGNRTLDLAARNGLVLTKGRHDRKSGGELGVSGRSSIQPRGLVDVIAHLVRTGNDPQQLELVGRVPGLPASQTIELMGADYISWGTNEQREASEESKLDELLTIEPV